MSMPMPATEPADEYISHIRDLCGLSGDQKAVLIDYYRHMRLRDLTHATIRCQVLEMAKFFRYLNEIGSNYLCFRTQDAFEYRNRLITADEEYTKRTVNNMIGAASSFYRFLFRQGRIPANPFIAGCTVRGAHSLPRTILTVEQMGQLLDGFRPDMRFGLALKTMMELLYGSALRLSEVLALKAADIDHTGGYVTVTEKKNRGRRRRVPASETSLRWLDRYVASARDCQVTLREKENGFVFSQKETLWRGLRALLHERCRTLGLPRITPHCFRHSAATHMLRAGAGIREVQAFLGHRSLGATVIYTHIIKEDLKKVIKAFHPRGTKEAVNEKESEMSD